MAVRQLLAASMVILGTLASTAVPPAQGQATPTFSGNTTGAVIDVLVRDKRGLPITDLVRGDFSLSEDGVPQQILSVVSVTPKTDALPSHESVAGHAALTALVFERLTPESRSVATQAAAAYLSNPQNPTDRVGIFLIDLRLATLQNFTSNRSLIAAQLTQAASRATSFDNRVRLGLGTGATPTTVGAEYNETPDKNRLTSTPQDSDDVAARAEDAFRELEILQHGHSSIDGLEALISSMGGLAGRKTIVYFSDGLALSGRGSQVADVLKTRFNQMLARANRYNISIYPVDCVGLRVHSQDQSNAQALRHASAADSDSAGSGAAMGTALSILQGGSTSQVFGTMAGETDGFVVENTNDLKSGFVRIETDQHYYYLLSYVPQNQRFNGETRRVKVSVQRRGVSIRWRREYLAIRMPLDQGRQVNTSH